jgi:WD40 repeat protein
MRTLSITHTVLFLFIIILASACTQSPTGWSKPLTPISSSTPSITPFPSPTTIPTYIPIIPALPGTQATDANTAISPENIDRLALFARWGNGNTSHAQYTSNGKFLVASSSTGIYFYNSQDYSLINYIDLQAPVITMALAPDDQKIAAATFDKVFILEPENHQPTLSIDKTVSSLAFSPNGQALALGTYKRTNGRFGNIELWDIVSGEKILDFENSADWISSIVFSPNGEFLATAGYATKIWNLEGQLLDTQGNYVSGGNTKSLSFSSDGTLLAEGADTASGLHVWRILQNGKLVIYRTIPMQGYEVAISPDGKWLAVDGNGLFVWQLDTGKLKHQLNDVYTRYSNIAWSPDSKSIVTSSSEYGIEIWNNESGELLQNINKLTGAITALDWLPEGKTIARATDNGEIALIDSSSGNILQTFQGYSFQPDFAISSDGNWLAINSYPASRGVEIVNLRESDIRYTLPNSNGAGLSSASFSLDGKYLVTSGFEGSKKIIQIWSTEDWNLYNFWIVGDITDSLLFSRLIFNPNGETVALYMSSDTAVKVFQITEGTLVETIGTRPNSIAFSPDGQFLLSMSEKINTNNNSTQFLFLWRVDDGGLEFMVDNLKSRETIPPTPPYYHNLPNAIDWSPNGELFAVGFADGTIGVFRASDRQLLQTLIGHTMRVTGVAFSPDGQILGSGSLDGTIRLWGVK